MKHRFTHLIAVLFLTLILPCTVTAQAESHDHSGQPYAVEGGNIYLLFINGPQPVVVDADETVTSVILPEKVAWGYYSPSLSSVSYEAFSGCTALRSITIPDTPLTIHGISSSSLQEILVSDGNSHYSSKDGVLFTKDEKALICYPGGKNGPYTIPSSVTSLGENAFRGCIGLTAVSIPTSISSIGISMFQDCSSLAEVTLPNSLTDIGSSAFSNCPSLKTLTIPNRVTSIGSSAFANCTALTDITIPSNITSIDSSTFSGCKELKCVILPDTLQSIGSSAFYDCDKLTDVYFGGSEAQWLNVVIDNGNAPLFSANIHYNSTGPAFLPGDVNRDGKVNSTDRTILARYLARWTGYGESSIDTKAADVTGDGKVDSRDRTILARHLARWKGYETLPAAAQ